MIVAQVNDLSSVVADLKDKTVQKDKIDETDTLGHVQYGQCRFFIIILFCAHKDITFHNVTSLH